MKTKEQLIQEIQEEFTRKKFVNFHITIKDDNCLLRTIGVKDLINQPSEYSLEDVKSVHERIFNLAEDLKNSVPYTDKPTALSFEISYKIFDEINNGYFLVKTFNGSDYFPKEKILRGTQVGDRNGREIYEGDICRKLQTYQDYTNPITGVIIYKNGCFFWKTDKDRIPLFELVGDSNYSCLEIIKI